MRREPDEELTPHYGYDMAKELPKRRYGILVSVAAWLPARRVQRSCHRGLLTSSAGVRRVLRALKIEAD